MEDIILYPGVELEDVQAVMEDFGSKKRKMTGESELKIKIEDCIKFSDSKEKSGLNIGKYELIVIDSDSDIEEEFHAVVDNIKCEEVQEKPQFDSLTSKVRDYQMSEQQLFSDKLFPSLCRLCAVPSSEMIDMFGPTILHNSIIEKIHHCLPITVTETDSLTKQICLLCLQRLESCYRFFETVTQAEKQLHSIREQIIGKLVRASKIHHQSSSRNNGPSPSFDKDPPNDRELVEGSDRDADNIAAEKEKSPSCRQVNTETLVGTLDSGRKSVSQSEQDVCPAASNSPVPEIHAEEEFRSEEGAPEPENDLSPNTREKSKPQGPKLRNNVTGSPYSLRKRKAKKFNRYSDDFLYSNEAIESSKTTTTTSAQQSTANQSIQCRICSKFFKTLEKCKSHAGLHASRSYRPCCFCNTILKTEESWKKHWLYHFVNETEAGSSLRRSRIRRCDECGKETATAFELWKHKRCHEPGANNPENGKREQFRNKVKPNAHEPKPTVKNNLCPDCNQIYLHNVTLEEHKKTCGRKITNFTCDICQKVFALKPRLRCHMLTHDDYREHCCDICPMRFKRKCYLTAHRKIHTGESPYKCPHCELNFAYTTVLRSHIAREHPEHVLTQLSDLTKSKITPRGPLINKCDECGEKFASPIRLQNHKLSHKYAAKSTHIPEKYDKVSNPKLSVAQHVSVRNNDQLKTSGTNISGEDSRKRS